MKQKPKASPEVIVNANSGKPLRLNGSVLESPGDRPMPLKSIGSRIRKGGQAMLKRWARSESTGFRE